jgi:glutamate 5-kinase
VSGARDLSFRKESLSTEQIRKGILQQVKRTVVKLGSNVLTTAGWKLDRKVFADITATIARARKRRGDFILVSSGAIAAGMGKLGFRERPRLIPLEQAAAAIGQISLMGLYQRLFGQLDVSVAQVLLTHSDLKDRRRFLNARHALSSLLEYHIIPIINENDSTVVDEIRFGDNDHLSALVTSLVQADLLIILTDIDGLYDRDPKSSTSARLIPLVHNITADIERLANGTRSTISRGGMATKIAAAKTAALSGVPTIIANGKIPGNLDKILQGKDVGTLILPEQSKLASRKHWIAFTLKPQGEIIVDDGAKDAILKRGTSLLPSGIIRVRGEFDAGEAVTCCDAQGAAFARGLTRYGSAEIERIRGCKTVEIKRVLGHCPAQEVINRDDLAVLREEHHGSV